jgi:two-component system, NtrC family, sensor kinase
MTALPPDVETDLSEENTRLKGELRAARDRQAAGAEILRTIAGAPGDAERSLQRIAEITERLFGASSVSLLIADGERWGRTIRVGAGSERIAAAIPLAHVAITSQFMPGAVYLENRQVHVADVDDPAAMARWPGLAPARTAGTRTMSGTPLRREGKAIGALIVHRDRPMPFTEDELALLQSFADQAAIATENARLFNETQEALARQTATSEILRVISQSPTDVQPVFDAIVLTATRLFRRDLAFILGCDATSYWPVATAGPEGLLAPPDRRPVAIDTDANFPSRVIVTGKKLHLPDWSAVELPDYERMVHKRVGINSALYLPLLREGKCIGLLGIAGKRAGIFGESEIALAESFRDQALIAIENARLFNETNAALARQTATSDILRVISQSPTDVQPVFDAIVRTATRLLRCDMAFFLRCHGATFSQAALVGSEGSHMVLDLTPVPIDPNTNFPSRAIVSKKNLYLPDWSTIDLPEHERHIREKYGINSALFLPLLRAGECVGLLALAGKRTDMFGEREIALAESFRDQALIAIENTRLFNETQEALERQTATADILKVIASSPNDVQPVFEAIAASAKRLLGGFSATVVRFVGDALHLVAFTPTNATADQALQASFPMPLAVFSAFELVRGGQTVQFTDTELEDVPRINREIARLRGYRSMVFTPLMSNGTPIGMISVTRKEPGSFSAHYVQLLQTFADQAVIAVENVRLFNETKEALERQTATADILKVIASSPSDVQPVFEAIAERSKRLVDALSTTVFRLVDGVMHLRAFTPTNPEADATLKAIFPVPLSSFSWGEAIAKAEIFRVIDTELEIATIRDLARLRGFRSMLFVPLLRDRTSIGVIAVTRVEPGPFVEHHVQLLQTFADQAVIAIENARLFDEVQARTRELSQSLDELRTAQDRLVQTEKLASLGQLTAGIAHEIKNPLNFVNNFSALSAELTDELNDVLKSATLAGNIREEVDELTGLLKDNLEKVVQHGKRADSIVKNMLLHSREGSGEHRPADINALLEESLNLAYHGARAEKPQFNVTLQRDFDEAAGTIEVFPQEITRVFLNLISNGFYAVTRRKMEIGHSGFDPILSATTRNLGHAVEIRIRDNGTGIPAEVKEKMFNPFFTTKPAGEGTGLGLSMSHDIIVKQHGGRIDVETEPGRFTEFTIVLPRASTQSDKNRGPT